MSVFMYILWVQCVLTTRLLWQRAHILQQLEQERDCSYRYILYNAMPRKIKLYLRGCEKLHHFQQTPNILV